MYIVFVIKTVHSARVGTQSKISLDIPSAQPSKQTGSWFMSFSRSQKEFNGNVQL